MCKAVEARSASLNQLVSPVQRRRSELNPTEKVKKRLVGFSSLFDPWLSKTMPKNISYEKNSLHDGDVEFDMT